MLPLEAYTKNARDQGFRGDERPHGKDLEAKVMLIWWEGTFCGVGIREGMTPSRACLVRLAWRPDVKGANERNL